MASSEMGLDFDSWLKELLHSHGADGEVFGEYISGTLATIEEASRDEINENLVDILCGCVEDETVCTTMVTTITDRWMGEVEKRREEERKRKELEKESELAKQSLANSQAKEASSSRQASAGLGGLSASEKKKLVAQYGCESDGDSGVDEDELVRGSGGGGGGATFQALFQNVNASTVAEAERTKKREQKAAHEAKLERDRKGRDAQKQKAQDRKEKEKKRTQKQERRR